MMMRCILARGTCRFFATAAPAASRLPRCYADVAVKKGPEYFDYAKHILSFGNQDDYEIIRRLGSGRYSGVFEGVNIVDQKRVTIKILRKVKLDKIKREVRILTALKDCPAVPRLYETVIDPASRIPSLILEYADNDDVIFTKLVAKMSPSDVKYYMQKLLSYLDGIHSRGIMHRDVKPQNLIINHRTKEVKIIDWGLAEFYIPGKKFHPRVATRYYKSPEILVGMEEYHYALDIWSLGCIFAAIILRRDPFFKGVDNADQLLKIARIMGTGELFTFLDKYEIKLPADVKSKMPNYTKKPLIRFVSGENAAFATTKAVDLLSRMLTYDQAERITAREALQHPYFNNKS